MLRDRAKQRLRERVEERLAPPEIAQTPVERDPEFDAKAEEAIPADVRMISGCHDTQTSADVQNVSTFQLPDAAGKAGGALTSAMLNIIYQEEQPSAQDLSFVDVFLKARDLIKENGFTQTPQLSSSRNIDVSQPFDLMTNEFGSEGTRYAVLIGINYVNHTQGRLSGCHNDVYNIKKYIMDVGKFEEENIVCLLDDGAESEPSRDGIMEALDDLVNKCQPGDTAFVHYSGHGGRVRDETGQDPSGYNSTLCPVDYDTKGQILDKELYQHLVCAMVLDLPYNFVGDGEHTEMEPNRNFPFLILLALGKVIKERRAKIKEAGGRREFRAARREDRREARRERLFN